jgi:hypothetical protein
VIDEYFFELAQESADIANASGNGDNNIKAEWIYCQWYHESAGFLSDLADANKNLGGLCQTQPNDTPQPDGDQYYMNFPSFKRYAEYFGWYLSQYREDGIYEAQSLDEYVAALKHGGYFGDSYENYIAGCKSVLREEFGVIEFA